MASKALKGLTIKIGGDTSELLDSLKDVEKRGKDLSGELGQINKLLKLDPKNTELVAQKQKVLADAISNTGKKLDTLKEAEKQAQKQFERGEISEEQYRALQREIIATESKLDKYTQALKETAEAQEKLADSADDAGKELDEQADKTREADRASEDLDDSTSGLAAGGLAALTAAATAAVASIVALAEESREYRTEMAKLDTAFTDAGYSAQAATKTYEALQSIIGETDQAVEASNMLAKLCDTEENLAEWTDILTGVYGTFGASLPIEGLAEAANETKRVGQVTGPLADALNWAAKEGETFGVTLKKNTKANEEWNKKVKEAASAEDYFNLALEECSNEQERQQLITKTLTKLYGSAAEQYKKTNKEIIRSNEATEKWNKATAKIGKAVDPVVTDIKEMGVTLLEYASDPLEDIAGFIQKKVLPAIEKTGKWVKNNWPTIKGALIGVAAGMVAYKVATIATTVVQKGLTGAIKSTTAAQKALNLVQNATPLGLVATAIVGVTVAMAAMNKVTYDAKKPAADFTEEEKKLMKAADEAAEAFREQKKATDEALGNVTTNMDKTKDLADELLGLADASGKVKEKDKERANFIIGALNDALGTEYQMVDGVIQKYDTLKTSIDEVIKSKRANALLEAANEAYVAAVQNEADALENANLKYEDYQAQIEVVAEKKALLEQAEENYRLALGSTNQEVIESANRQLLYAKNSYGQEVTTLEKKKGYYEEAAGVYSEYYNTIANYEEAQGATLEGNYQKAVDILSRKGNSYVEYSDKVDTETAKVLNTLHKEAIDAGIEAQRIKKNFENGVDGYTAEMVTEAETNYQKAMDEFATAYADAESVGEDLTDGMTAGAEKKRPSLLAKARSLVQGFLGAVADESDSHSPSRKAIKLFEYIGEGAAIGVENKTEDVERAGTEQAAALLGAYSSQEVAAQKTLRNIADQQSARLASGQLAVASTNGPMLEKILAAIEKGQVLTLDGDAVVGATADRMDNALGRRRALAARGAT